MVAEVDNDEVIKIWSTSSQNRLVTFFFQTVTCNTVIPSSLKILLTALGWISKTNLAQLLYFALPLFRIFDVSYTNASKSIFKVFFSHLRSPNGSNRNIECSATGYKRLLDDRQHPRISILWCDFSYGSYLWAESEFTLDRAKEKCHGKRKDDE